MCEKEINTLHHCSVSGIVHSYKYRKAVIYAYLVRMKSTKIVQFVCFETILDSEKFISQWEQFNRTANSDIDVTLQQNERNGVFRYVAQHRCDTAAFKFVFSKAGKSSRTPEIGIKVKQAGGYLMTQEQRQQDVRSNESKIFVFIVNNRADLDQYRQINNQGDLNIYEAYYENCQYAYILEFFISSKNATSLIEQLRQLDTGEIGIYKECVMVAA